MAVVGVLAQTDVGDYQQIGSGLLDDAYGLLDYTAGLVGLGAFGVLSGRYSEQEDGGYAQVGDLAHLLDQVVEGDLEDTRHGGHLVADVAAVRHEDGVHEVVRREGRLAQHASQALMLSEPA